MNGLAVLLLTFSSNFMMPLMSYGQGNITLPIYNKEETVTLNTK